MKRVNPWRPFIFVLGVLAGAVSCYGAYEYALKLEGGFSYLAIGAPIVAIFATVIPPIAENAWKHEEYFKSVLWWLTLIPAGSLIFFSAAERVHMAKADHEAKITALYRASVRAKTDLDDAKNFLKTAEADEAKAKSLKTCNVDCKSKLEIANVAREKLAVAEANLFKTESASVEDSKLKAPVWLLPVALDIIAFMAVWTGLSKPWVVNRFGRRLRTRPFFKQIPIVRKKDSIKFFRQKNTLKLRK